MDSPWSWRRLGKPGVARPMYEYGQPNLPSGFQSLDRSRSPAIMGNARTEVDVRTSRADDSVDRSVDAVLCHDTVMRKVGDWSLNEGDIWFGECFEVARTRSESTTVGGKIWDYLIEKLWLVD